MQRVWRWALVLSLSWRASSALADPPPVLVVVVLDAALDPADASSIVLRALATQPDGRVLTRQLGRVNGACTIDVGGLESLSVARCALASGDQLELEIVQPGARVFVDTYLTRPGGERRRTGHVVLARLRPGWAAVPRCRETFEDPLACPPPREPIVARSPAPCRVELTLTELDEVTRRPTLTRHSVAVTDHGWGDADREDDGWLRLAPTPITLAAARTSPDVRVTPIAARPVAFRETDAGALTYRFDAQGRTIEIHWDPQADSREYVYRYLYTCR